MLYCSVPTTKWFIIPDFPLQPFSDRRTNLATIQSSGISSISNDDSLFSVRTPAISSLDSHCDLGNIWSGPGNVSNFKHPAPPRLSYGCPQDISINCSVPSSLIFISFSMVKTESAAFFIPGLRHLQHYLFWICSICSIISMIPPVDQSSPCMPHV